MTSSIHIEKTSPQKPRILIVDDNPMSARLIEVCLKQHGCETKVITRSDVAVLEMIKEDYDLVILDWMMPDKTGGETLKSAQNMISLNMKLSLPWTKISMPVVTYSGQSSEKMEIPFCNNFKIMGHLSKTLPYSQLRGMVSGVLQVLRLI